MLASALIATISMSTSPAVVLAVTRELRAQGQVTERVLLMTALNSIYAVVLSTLLLAWARVESRGILDDYLLHPVYLILGSLLLAAVGRATVLLVAGFVGRDRAAQLMLMLALVSLVFASAIALRLSPLLGSLACGAFARAFDRERRLASSDIGLVSALALMLFFALSAATVDFGALLNAGLPALALALARTACRRAGRWVPLTGIVWRKGLLVGLGLPPMSAIAMMLTQQVTLIDPQLGAQAGNCTPGQRHHLPDRRRPDMVYWAARQWRGEDGAMSGATIETATRPARRRTDERKHPGLQEIAVADDWRRARTSADRPAQRRPDARCIRPDRARHAQTVSWRYQAGDHREHAGSQHLSAYSLHSAACRAS